MFEIGCYTESIISSRFSLEKYTEDICKPDIRNKEELIYGIYDDKLFPMNTLNEIYGAIDFFLFCPDHYKYKLSQSITREISKYIASGEVDKKDLVLASESAFAKYANRSIFTINKPLYNPTDTDDIQKIYNMIISSKPSSGSEIMKLNRIINDMIKDLSDETKIHCANLMGYLYYKFAEYEIYQYQKQSKWINLYWYALMSSIIYRMAFLNDNDRPGRLFEFRQAIDTLVRSTASINIPYLKMLHIASGSPTEYHRNFQAPDYDYHGTKSSILDEFMIFSNNNIINPYHPVMDTFNTVLQLGQKILNMEYLYIIDSSDKDIYKDMTDDDDELSAHYEILLQTDGFIKRKNIFRGVDRKNQKLGLTGINAVHLEKLKDKIIGTVYIADSEGNRIPMYLGIEPNTLYLVLWDGNTIMRISAYKLTLDNYHVFTSNYKETAKIEVTKIMFDTTKVLNHISSPGYDYREYSVFTEGLSIDKSGNIKLSISSKKTLMDLYMENHRLIAESDKNKNYEGVKQALANAFALISIIERKEGYRNKKKDSELVKARAFLINDFKTYMKKLQDAEPDFDFVKYYKESDYDKTIVDVPIGTISGIKQIVKSILS